MTASGEFIPRTVEKLVELYDRPFGGTGKKNGRYRIPVKLVRQIAGRRRLYEDDVRDLARAMLERGYVLIDMDSFFVVTSANTYVNYRRANEDCLE
ncbi:hypothetical protein [Roseibium sp.]|uniref:hypothetical protein n=1 Tax=Roseibium sp. TaxID=1936156 RepID=UPI003A9884CF